MPVDPGSADCVTPEVLAVIPNSKAAGSADFATPRVRAVLPKSKGRMLQATAVPKADVVTPFVRAVAPKSKATAAPKADAFGQLRTALEPWLDRQVSIIGHPLYQQALLDCYTHPNPDMSQRDQVRQYLNSLSDSGRQLASLASGHCSEDDVFVENDPMDDDDASDMEQENGPMDDDDSVDMEQKEVGGAEAKHRTEQSVQPGRGRRLKRAPSVEDDSLTNEPKRHKQSEEVEVVEGSVEDEELCLAIYEERLRSHSASREKVERLSEALFAGRRLKRAPSVDAHRLSGSHDHDRSRSPRPSQSQPAIAANVHPWAAGSYAESSDGDGKPSESPTLCLICHEPSCDCGCGEAAAQSSQPSRPSASDAPVRVLPNADVTSSDDPGSPSPATSFFR